MPNNNLTDASDIWRSVARQFANSGLMFARTTPEATLTPIPEPEPIVGKPPLTAEDAEELLSRNEFTVELHRSLRSRWNHVYPRNTINNVVTITKTSTTVYTKTGPEKITLWTANKTLMTKPDFSRVVGVVINRDLLISKDQLINLLKDHYIEV